MAEIIDLKNYMDEPDYDQMDEAQLRACLAALRAQIAALDLVEPEDMESEAYETWGERHEALEDQVDEILDCLDELG